MSNQELDQELIQFLNLTEDSYNNLLLDKAEEWLVKTFPQDSVSREEMKSNRCFWYWWKNLWDKRNRKLFLDINPRLEEGELLKRFKQGFYTIHHVNNINEFPSHMVFETSYAQMIGNLIDETHAKANQ